jgi:hypothetical protein
MAKLIGPVGLRQNLAKNRMKYPTENLTKKPV